MTRQALCRALIILAAIAALGSHYLPVSGALSRGLNAAWTWTLTTPAGLGSCQASGCNNVRIASLAAFNGALFAGTENAWQGAEIWQYNGSTWTRQAQGGLGDVQNSSIASMAIYGSALYAGTQQSESSGAEVWAYAGGHWARVLSGGFDESTLPSDPKNTAAAALASFSGKLYIGTRYDYRGAQIWSYDGITATQVVSGGLANVDNVAVISLAAFNDAVYAGTLNYAGGGEIWRSSDGVQWARISSGGFGNPRNIGIASMAVMSDALYAGTQNLNWETGTGAEIWRSTDGLHWFPVLTGGFADPALYIVNSMAVHNGLLYAGAGHSTLPQAEVWAYDGQSWQRALSGGLSSGGQVHTFSEARSLAAYNGALYMGTSQVTIGVSPAAPEVWRSSGAVDVTPTATTTAAGSPTRTATTTPTRTTTPTATRTATPTWAAGRILLFLPLIVR